MGLASRRGGENYGWNVTEGSQCYSPASGCNRTGLTLPVYEYTHSEGCSVTGGVVYRGCRMPELAGTYFFGDYCTGLVRSFRLASGQATDVRDWTASVRGVNSPAAFGLDADGEVYVVDYDGEVYRLDARKPARGRQRAHPSRARVAPEPLTCGAGAGLRPPLPRGRAVSASSPARRPSAARDSTVTSRTARARTAVAFGLRRCVVAAQLPRRTAATPPGPPRRSPAELKLKSVRMFRHMARSLRAPPTSRARGPPARIAARAAQPASAVRIRPASFGRAYGLTGTERRVQARRST